MFIFQTGQKDLAKFIVISLSIQPVLSMAQNYNLSPELALKKLTGLI